MIGTGRIEGRNGCVRHRPPISPFLELPIRRAGPPHDKEFLDFRPRHGGIERRGRRSAGKIMGWHGCSTPRPSRRCGGRSWAQSLPARGGGRASRHFQRRQKARICKLVLARRFSRPMPRDVRPRQLAQGGGWQNALATLEAPTHRYRRGETARSEEGQEGCRFHALLTQFRAIVLWGTRPGTISM